jgi:hypothetical protein
MPAITRNQMKMNNNIVLDIKNKSIPIENKRVTQNLLQWFCNNVKTNLEHLEELRNEKIRYDTEIARLKRQYKGIIPRIVQNALITNENKSRNSHFERLRLIIEIFYTIEQYIADVYNLSSRITNFITTVYKKIQDLYIQIRDFSIKPESKIEISIVTMAINQLEETERVIIPYLDKPVIAVESIISQCLSQVSENKSRVARVDYTGMDSLEEDNDNSNIWEDTTIRYDSDYEQDNEDDNIQCELDEKYDSKFDKYVVYDEEDEEAEFDDEEAEFDDEEEEFDDEEEEFDDEEEEFDDEEEEFDEEAEFDDEDFDEEAEEEEDADDEDYEFEEDEDDEETGDDLLIYLKAINSSGKKNTHIRFD